MTKKELKRLVLSGLAAAGWIYAIMLTRKEISDVWQGVPWYEMLTVSLLGFGVLFPLLIWIWIRFSRKFQKGEVSSKIDSTTQKKN
jgi:hypothetical protein